MVRRKVKWVPIILCVIFLAALTGCPGMQIPGEQPKVKSLEEMTPKEKSTWMMAMYNAQARDYKSMVKRTDLTNDQKDILRKKKAIMTEVWPLINTYKSYVDTGAVPTKQTEEQIIGLINDLTSKVLPAVVGEGG